MTRKEFEVFRLSLEKEKFPTAISDPIEYGIHRTIFKREKLKKLINIGKNIRSRTVQSKIERWKRQLDRLGNSQEHLTALKKELDAAKISLTARQALRSAPRAAASL